MILDLTILVRSNYVTYTDQAPVLVYVCLLAYSVCECESMGRSPSVKRKAVVDAGWWGSVTGWPLGPAQISHPPQFNVSKKIWKSLVISPLPLKSQYSVALGVRAMINECGFLLTVTLQEIQERQSSEATLLIFSPCFQTCLHFADVFIQSDNLQVQS